VYSGEGHLGNKMLRRFFARKYFFFR